VSNGVVRSVAVRGVVCAVPGDPIPIAELEHTLTPAELEKTRKAVGLEYLHRAPRGVTAGDLSVAAARRLLERLAWEPESVDGVVMVTQTPDHFLPATACVAHRALGLSDGCFAFDVGMGCSGYVYGLWLAGTLCAGGARRVLVLAGDTISHLISPEDPSVSVLFGDAGSATALELDPQAGPASFVLGTDGTGVDNLKVPAGAFRERFATGHLVRTADAAGGTRAPADLYMDGLAIFNFTLKRVPALVRSVLELHGWGAEDVDAFLFHQANAFILTRIAGKLGLPAERVPTNISRYGNTSMASIPLLLAENAEALRAARPDARVLLAGFGVGYSWAGAALSLGGVRAAEVIRLPVPA
jgi:3-oxoacyl-[acyl-carrier-protein] synthase III